MMIIMNRSVRTPSKGREVCRAERGQGFGGIVPIVWAGVSLGRLVRTGPEAMTMKVDEVAIGSYPRDDVLYSWVKDGLVRAGTANDLRPHSRRVTEAGR